MLPGRDPEAPCSQIIVEAEPRLGRGGDGDNMKMKWLAVAMMVRLGFLPCRGVAVFASGRHLWLFSDPSQKHPRQWAQLFCLFRDEKTEML